MHIHLLGSLVNCIRCIHMHAVHGTFVFSHLRHCSENECCFWKSRLKRMLSARCSDSVNKNERKQTDRMMFFFTVELRYCKIANLNSFPSKIIRKKSVRTNEFLFRLHKTVRAQQRTAKQLNSKNKY